MRRNAGFQVNIAEHGCLESHFAAHSYCSSKFVLCIIPYQGFFNSLLVKADYIVVVCTEKYVAKANSGQGGVGYEKGILSASMMKDINQNKVIPILRGTSNENVPTFLSSKLYIDFSKDDDVEYSLDDLLRVLLNAPLYEKPEVGQSPFEPMNNSRPNRIADGVRNVMSTISLCYNDSDEKYVRYWSVRRASNLPRLSMDKYIQECRNLGYLGRVNTN